MCVCLVRLEAYKLTQPRTINLAATNRDPVAAACVFFFLFANLSNLTIWQAANEWELVVEDPGLPPSQLN